VDQAATQFIDACNRASQDTMKPIGRHRAANVEWWNDKCREAQDNYQFSNLEDRSRCRAIWKGTVQQESRNHWTKVIEESNPAKIFQLAAKCQGQQLRGVQALRSDEGLAVTPEQQSKVLRAQFFPEVAPQVPLSLPFDPLPRPTRPFPDFTTHEMTTALAGTSKHLSPRQLRDWLPTCQVGFVCPACTRPCALLSMCPPIAPPTYLVQGSYCCHSKASQGRHGQGKGLSTHRSPGDVLKAP
jgi:hypothetical protein